MKRKTLSERALVLAPRGRDATIAAAMLAEVGIAANESRSIDDLIRELNAGAGLVVMTEEALGTSNLHGLAAWIMDQQEWSDLPFILLTHRGGLERNPSAKRYLDILSNVTFLERPFHPTTLVSLAQAALRGRRRQYEARARLEELRRGDAQLRELNATLEERVGHALAERKLFADIVATTEGSFQALDHDLRFLAINASAEADYRRMFGIVPKVGQTMSNVLGHAPDQLESVASLWRRVLGGESFNETNWWGSDGFSKRAYEMQFRPLRDHDGHQIGAYLFGQDVTERLQDQQRLTEATAQLHEAQKLETLGQLTGGVAHDFNNLLTPIIGALDLVRRRHRNDPRSARLLDGALQSGERAKTLVQRLLGFARRQSLETRAVDLSRIVRDMEDLIRSSIGSTIELKMQPIDDLPPAIADPNQLELAILNICVNARDAMPSGGTLTVSVAQTAVAADEVTTLEPGDYLRISVEDTGVGMDEETLRRAVEPFYSTKGVGKGTGLGLSMVHGLAGQLGGAFTMTSAPGKGTRANLYLPIASNEAVAAIPRMAKRALPPDRPLRLLLVDDEDLVRAGTTEMLRELGHDVVEAAGGADALRQLEAGLGVDAILTDYMMPGMDGAGLALRVREMGLPVPILVITGYAGGDLDIGLPLLAKPFRQVDLGEALRSLMQPKSNVVAMSRIGGRSSE